MDTLATIIVCTNNGSLCVYAPNGFQIMKKRGKERG